MTRRAVLIVNPTSGSYRAGKIAEIVQRLESAGIQVQTAVTGRAEDAGLFARDACLKEAEPFLIAAGGDGTINGVANGLTSWVCHPRHPATRDIERPGPRDRHSLAGRRSRKNYRRSKPFSAGWGPPGGGCVP